MRKCKLSTSELRRDIWASIVNFFSSVRAKKSSNLRVNLYSLLLSCFPAKPRRQQNESNLITDRKAFRLCIDAADKRKLLDESKWPDSIVISEWYYLNPASQINSATTAASYAATSASTSASEAVDERSEV